MVQIGSERKTVQNPLIRYAIEAGWSYLVPGECLRLRCGETSSILWEVFEAHRTTGGDLGDFLMGALPNATYLGFTGTPIDKTAYGKGTFKVFGIDDPQGYLDKYSIAESIEDGTTVPLYYTLAPNELRVDRETLEQEFLDLVEAEGVSDVEDLNRILEKAVTLRNMLKNGERAEAIAATFKQRQLSTQEALRQLADLVHEINEAEREQAERGISGAPFAVFWLLKQAGTPLEYAQTVAAAMAKVFKVPNHGQLFKALFKAILSQYDAD